MSRKREATVSETLYEAALAAAGDLYRAEVRRQSIGWDEHCTELLVRSQHRLAAAIIATPVGDDQ